MVERPRVLIAGEWLVLEPIDGGARTRLIARTRGGWLEAFARRIPLVGRPLGVLAGLIDRWPLELLHHYMEAGMLTGVKARVEASGSTIEIESQAASPPPSCSPTALGSVTFDQARRGGSPLIVGARTSES